VTENLNINYYNYTEFWLHKLPFPATFSLGNYKNSKNGWVLVAQACNPSYSEADISRITIQSQPREMVCETLP
jgi:hypothetical protein